MEDGRHQTEGSYVWKPTLVFFLVGGLLLPPAVSHSDQVSTALEDKAAWEADDSSSERRIIEAVIVDGNLRTRTNLIKRVLDLEPPIPLDERRLEEGRQRLMDLGLFVNVLLRLERGEQRGGVVLVVRVVERGSLLLSDLFLGFTDVTPFYGGFGVADTNVAGTALFAHGAFVLGSEGRRAFHLSVSDPNILNRYSLGLGLIHLRGLELHCPGGFSACDAEELSRLEYRRTGGRASAGLLTGDASRVGFHYRFESLHSRTSGELSAGDDDEEWTVALGLPPMLIGPSRISSLTVSFEHDTTDDPFLARRGILLDLYAEVGSELFFSSYEYSRYGARLDTFWPGFGKHSIQVGAFGGFIQGDAPFFDRFHVADHSFFTVGANAVPRALGISFTEVSQYDDVLLAVDVGYRIPLRLQGRFIYRSYFHASAALTLSAHTVDGSLLDLSLDPRNEISRFPLSGDLGLRLDTTIGSFSLGLSYPLDLML